MGEIWRDIQTIENQLNSALQTLRQNGLAYAQANKEYRVAKANKILELKANGIPTTLIPDLAKGDMNVAELDMKRLSAEAIYRANEDAIRVKQQEYAMARVYYEKEYSIGGK